MKSDNLAPRPENPSPQHDRMAYVFIKDYLERARAIAGKHGFVVMEEIDDAIASCIVQINEINLQKPGVYDSHGPVINP